MASSDPISLFRGEDVIQPFVMSPVVDITGWVIEFTIRLPNGRRLVKTATVTDGPAGEFEVALSAEDTDIPQGAYLYTTFRTDAGSERALAVGRFTVKPTARAS